MKESLAFFFAIFWLRLTKVSTSLIGSVQRPRVVIEWPTFVLGFFFLPGPWKGSFMWTQKHHSSFCSYCPLALSTGPQDQSPYVSLRKWFGREAVEMLVIGVEIVLIRSRRKKITKEKEKGWVVMVFYGNKSCQITEDFQVCKKLSVIGILMHFLYIYIYI